jgi:TonB family protein
MFSTRCAQTVVSSLSLTACATTGTFGDSHEPRSRARVSLAPLTAGETLQVIPHAIEPMLPSADRLSRYIVARLGERATVDVRYCVSPSGALVSAVLARSSSSPHFDHAVMTDIARWRFVAQPGPAHVRTCQEATIVYRARS